MSKIPDLVEYSYELGKRILSQREPKEIKSRGQYLTPPTIARNMAKKLGEIQSGSVLLEPAVGSGVLVCAVIERLISENQSIEITADVYEIDPELCEITKLVFAKAGEKAAKNGISFYWHVFQEDFILSCLPETQPSLFSNKQNRRTFYDYILSNPPYFKLNSEDERVKAVSGKIKGHTNIYTIFMALSTKMLTEQGRACFIVPRSFCSGVYFSDFRREFLRDATPLSVHLFQARGDVFKRDEVLQENLIFTFKKSSQSKSQPYWTGFVDISTSKNDVQLQGEQFTRRVSFKYFLNHRSKHLIFRLPTGVFDEQILDTVDRWEGSFEKYGLQVSTGPVVPFRAKELLRDDIANGNLPLLWMQNVKPYQVQWPLENLKKPQAISKDEVSLLVPKSNYVLLRRFSAKEDRRRLIAAPFISEEFPASHVGFENHLNFIYRKNGTLQIPEIFGLSALLNSALIDRYFRIINGNTQVNATELRALPFPPMEVIKQIGEKVQRIQNPNSEKVDSVVYSMLWETKYLDEHIPMIQETRITMGKIELTQEILEALGLPSAQQNEISALTLLVLAQLSEETPWNNATPQSLRVHDILLDIRARYGREYAENTRETIRRQVLHQFEQAGIVIRNPDDPTLATNSPKTHYALTEPVVSALQAFGTSEWENKRENFLRKRGALLEVYQKIRDQHKVPLQVAEGKVYKLSPGKHNKLQAAIVEEFGPRFAPGSKLLYLGDAARKTLILEEKILSSLGVQVFDHGKLPDVVLYDETRNWFFLIEAVTSHGPVSPKRYLELEEMFKNCSADRIYVTAFPDFTTFKRFVNEIAWETEVWIAELPSHLIHFNGDKFLGPHN